MTTPPRLVLVLSENWTLVSPRDLRALVRMAVEAEEAGIDTVMLSEHVVMGPSSGADGIMGNPRDYAAAGQPGSGDPVARLDRAGERDRRGDLEDPHRAGRRDRAAAPSAAARQAARRRSTCWPRGASSCSRPCRWHEDEYEALGVPFHERGAILDEQLVAMERAWTESPASFEGEALLVPRRVPGAEAVPARRGRGCGSAACRCTARCCAASSGTATASTRSARRRRRSWSASRVAMAEAGRDSADLEMIGGIRGRFADATSTADVEEAFASVPGAAGRGLHVDLLQAVDVHRRPGRGRRALPPAGGDGRGRRPLISRGSRPPAPAPHPARPRRPAPTASSRRAGRRRRGRRGR